MLLQIREVSSETLNIQTIGRIKRNPIKGLFHNKITDKYYIYSNYQEGKRSLASYKLKNKFNNLKLYQGKLSLDNNSIKLLEKDFYNKLKKFFKKSAIENIVIENSKKTKLPIENKKFSNKNTTENEYFIFVNLIFRLKI
jgi:type III restriction enzyme